MNTKFNLMWCLLISSSIIALDQLAKFAVLQTISPGESIPILKHFLDFTHVKNPGAAFGLLANFNEPARSLLLSLGFITSMSILAYLSRPHFTKRNVEAAALSLIFGGAIGNLLNRIQFGSVIDFIDFHYFSTVHFPSFNLADVAICIGVTTLLYKSYESKSLSTDEGVDHRSCVKRQP